MIDFINPEWIGGVAAVMTTGAYFPQAYKILKTKHTKSISLGMYSLMTFGVGLWLIYGVMIDKPAVIFANLITLLISLTILVAKLRFG